MHRHHGHDEDCQDGHEHDVQDIGSENIHGDSDSRPSTYDSLYTAALVIIIIIESILIFLFIKYHPKKPAPKLESKIVFGRPARLKEFPHHILVAVSDLSFICGGTIIKPSFALTAAHCFYGQEQKRWIIVAGTLHRDYDLHPVPSQQVRNVSRFWNHEKYDPPTTRNMDDDICLLFFKPPLTFTKYVKPAALPKRDTHVLGKCVLCGWGLRNYNCTYVYTEELYAGSIYIDHITQPPLWLITVTPLRQGVYTTQCHGDSGGGLMKKHLVTGAYTLVGIVSHRIYELCGDPFNPSEYTNVRNYLYWINSRIAIIERQEEEEENDDDEERKKKQKN